MKTAVLSVLLLLPGCAFFAASGGRVSARTTVAALLRAPDSPRFLVCGHRGDLLGSYLREGDNTIASFERAVAEGADLVEVDVQATADGIPVIRHDDDVAERTLEEWRAGGEDVLTLREALEWARGRTVLVLDLKTRAIREVVDEVLGAGAGAGVILYTGNRREYDAVRDASLGAWVMVRARDPRSAGQWLAEGDPRIALLHGDADWLTPDLVAKIRAAGPRVFANSYEAVWHQDLFGSGSGAARLFALGVDVAQTNETAGACRARDEALGER